MADSRKSYMLIITPKEKARKTERKRKNAIFDTILKEFNSQTEMRQFLAQFQLKQSISTLKSLELQAKSLRQLTESTNQLTRHVIVRLLRLVMINSMCSV